MIKYFLIFLLSVFFNSAIAQPNINAKSAILMDYDSEKILFEIDADLQIPNVNKFVNKTNWQPKITYQKTLEDLLNYWRIKIEKNGNCFLQR